MKNIFRISGIILIFFFIYSCKKDEDKTIKDGEGNVYTSVKIGTQEWLTENLKTTKYSNGDLIGTTSPISKDISSESTPKYQWSYNGDESKVASYGRLYTWYTITDNRNVCPDGWHIPSDDDWTVLTDYLGDRSIAGGKLKEIGTVHWISPNTGATNETGFSAIPGGYRYPTGQVDFIGYYFWCWSGTEFSSDPAMANMWYVHNSDSGIYYGPMSKYWGFTVRCIKD